MEIMHIPTEADVKRWVKEALVEYFQQSVPLPAQSGVVEEDFLNRKQTAAAFEISLVTLHNWMNRGFPYHKQGGRVYFLRSEIHEFVKERGGRQSISWAKLRYLSKTHYKKSA